MKFAVLVALVLLISLSAEEQSQKKYSIEECLDIALKNNHYTPASAYAVQMAESLHRQAMSYYSPSLGFKAVHTLMDEDLNFVIPPQPMDLGPNVAQAIAHAKTYQALTTGTGIPAAITPGNVAWQATYDAVYPTVYNQVVAGMKLSTTPLYDLTVMDRENDILSIGLSYPLYTGGLRGSMAAQAQAGVDASKQQLRKTNLKVVFDVKKYYYGSVMADRVKKIGDDTLDRLQATLDITERLYKEGSGTVKKTDYLRTRVMVQSVKSIVAKLEHAQTMTKSALANSMGLAWNEEITPSETMIPVFECVKDLPELVSSVYEFSPDWKRLEAGLKAAEAKITEKRSGHLPKLLLSGNVNQIVNSYNMGATSGDNKRSWVVGVGMEWHLFDGGRTHAKISEARAALKKLGEEKILLREGLGLKVKSIFTSMKCHAKELAANTESLGSAKENRDLNEKSYRMEMVETEDVIMAQLTEAFTEAQHEKSLFDQAEAFFELEQLIGEEIERKLQ